MKRTILLAILVLVLPSLACSFSLPNPPRRLETGPTQTLEISEPAPDSSSPAKVLVQMGAGRLQLQGGADGLAEGTIEYNVPDWKPTVLNENGQLTIKQGQTDRKNSGSFTADSDIVNVWKLKLGDVPMNLTINAGAYEGHLDLGGLRLRELTLINGACDNTLSFDKANPETMTELVYKTGASVGRLEGLGYANFEHMEFKGGVGDYSLDFSGELQRNASVDIETGMSSLRIVIPAGTKAEVVVEGEMKSVKTEGQWSVESDTYETGNSADYTLVIHVTMGLGELTLVHN